MVGPNLAILKLNFPHCRSFRQTILSRYQCWAQCHESTRFSMGVCWMVVELLDSKQDCSEILGEGQGEEREKQLCGKGQAVFCICLVCWLTKCGLTSILSWKFCILFPTLRYLGKATMMGLLVGRNVFVCLFVYYLSLTSFYFVGFIAPNVFLVSTINNCLESVFEMSVTVTPENASVCPYLA